MSESSDAPYRVGIATGDVTPPVGAPLAGFAGRKVHSSTDVYHPLRAVAIAIGDGTDSVLLINVEWLGFYDQTARVRKRLAQSVNLPVDRIVLTGTHTHCGPALRDSDRDRHGYVDEAFLDRALSNLAEIARRAWHFRYPARLRFGVGRCEFAINRRMPDPENPPRVKRGMQPNPDGPVDHDVPVLLIESADDGVLRGIVFSYACHPTSRGGLLIGGDYVGFAYDYLQEAYMHAQPCFLQGCAGDQKPRPVNRESDRFDRRSVSQLRELGETLGRAVEQVINNADALSPITGSLALKQMPLTLETEPVDRATLEGELHHEQPPYRRAWARYHLDRMERGLPQECQVPFEIQTLSFGQSLAAVFMAGEMTVEHGLRLKSELASRFQHVLPLGYANDIVGYVPVKRQFPEYGYEVLDSNQHYYLTGRYVEETEDRVHRTIHEMLGLEAFTEPANL